MNTTIKSTLRQPEVCEMMCVEKKPCIDFISSGLLRNLQGIKFFLFTQVTTMDCGQIFFLGVWPFFFMCWVRSFLSQSTNFGLSYWKHRLLAHVHQGKTEIWWTCCTSIVKSYARKSLRNDSTAILQKEITVCSPVVCKSYSQKPQTKVLR